MPTDLFDDQQSTPAERAAANIVEELRALSRFLVNTVKSVDARLNSDPDGADRDVILSLLSSKGVTLEKWLANRDAARAIVTDFSPKKAMEFDAVADSELSEPEPK